MNTPNPIKHSLTLISVCSFCAILVNQSASSLDSLLTLQKPTYVWSYLNNAITNLINSHTSLFPGFALGVQKAKIQLNCLNSKILAYCFPRTSTCLFVPSWPKHYIPASSVAASVVYTVGNFSPKHNDFVSQGLLSAQIRNLPVSNF